VLPRTEVARVWDLGGDPMTIGVRMPHEPLALAVLARTGPLAITSANRSGALTPTACDEIEATFADTVQVYLCAPEPLTGSASTVVDLAHGRPSVVRAGAVSERAIVEALRDLRSPGGSEGPV
jgi:tRNA A37 threonylcarbamoyladenosine synthetase subunit TsaC/SUA5/YrdC